MKDNIKYFVLAGLVALLAYLTLTRSGKSIASKIGESIMQLSQNGLDQIKKLETIGGKFSPRRYVDAGGYSIGYGHFIQPGEKFSEPISEPLARELLAKDTAIANNAVSKYVTVPLTQNQHDALVSFTYNVGAAALRGSTLLSKLNVGDYAGAANQFAVWHKKHLASGEFVNAPELVARRSAEKELFLT